jgi:branched-chain amino acid transport system ATP-binding protein
VASEPLLWIEGLDVAEGLLPRACGVGLALPEGGAVVALLGGAGAGKSAVLRAVAGIHPAEAGRILLRGEPVERLPPDALLARGVALAAQRPRVFLNLSLRDNLLLGAAHLPRATAREGLAWVFHLMPELAARRDRPVAQLGAPERRLLDIGRALMAQPLVLLLDEPCQDLGPERLSPLFAAVQGGWGGGVLLAERTVNAALRLADYGHLLVAGRVITRGRPDALAGDPRVYDACLGEAAGPV